MGNIKLKNIRTYSYHGCLVEEGKIGSDYTVDLEIKTDLRKSSISDNLEDTVDYVLLSLNQQYNQIQFFLLLPNNRDRSRF